MNVLKSLMKPSSGGPSSASAPRLDKMFVTRTLRDRVPGLDRPKDCDNIPSSAATRCTFLRCSVERPRKSFMQSASRLRSSARTDSVKSSSEKSSCSCRKSRTAADTVSTPAVAPNMRCEARLSSHAASASARDASELVVERNVLSTSVDIHIHIHDASHCTSRLGSISPGRLRVRVLRCFEAHSARNAECGTLGLRCRGPKRNCRACSRELCRCGCESKACRADGTVSTQNG